MKLKLGESSMWSILDSENTAGTNYSPSSGNKIDFLDDTIDVDIKTPDRIIDDLGIKPSSIRFLSLQVNGFEYLALEGSKRILAESQDLTVFIATGRADEGTIGYVDDVEDIVAISSFLKEYDFNISFIKFRPTSSQGILVAIKKHES